MQGEKHTGNDVKRTGPAFCCLVNMKVKGDTINLFN